MSASGDGSAIGEAQRLVDVDPARDDRELLAAPTREHVLRAQRFLHERCHRAKHVIAPQMSVRVVDALEVIEIEHQHRERGLVALRVREFGRETLAEMLSVVGAGERIENARFVEAPEQAFLGFVGEAEAELDARPERKTISLAERLGRHAVAADEGSVARTEVFEDVSFGSAANDPRVPAADARIFDANGAVPGATDDVLVEEERVHGAGVRATDERQRRAARHRGNAESSRLDCRRDGDRGNLFILLIELARPPTRRTRVSHVAPSPCGSPVPPHGPHGKRRMRRET
jgi:hypothetical protein